METDKKSSSWLRELWLALKSMPDIKATVETIQTDLDIIKDRETVGDISNIVTWTKNYEASDTLFVSAADIVAYSIRVIDPAATGQYILMFPCGTIYNVTGLTDSPTSPGVKTTVLCTGHPYINTNRVVLQNVVSGAGAVLIDGTYAVSNVVAGVSFDIINVYSATGTGRVTLEKPDTTSIPVDRLPIADAIYENLGNGERYATGLYLCTSSTADVKTVGSAGCFFKVGWAPKV